MKNTKQQPQATGKKKSHSAAPSSVDVKNNSVSSGYTPPTKRMKPKSGDGLANEGTIASYEGER